MQSSAVRICKLSMTLEDDWRALYHEAFPFEEREPEEKLVGLIAAGRMLYHRTEDASGKLICFTLVSMAPDHSLLAFMATDKNQRGGGYGSKHLTKLIEILKTQYSQHLGLFIEIEAVNPRNKILSDDERSMNMRRREFYLRHGANLLCPNAIYLTPNRGPKGGDWEGELLCVPFGTSGKINGSVLLRVITEIYQRFYCLTTGDALIERGLGQFYQCKSPDCAKHDNCGVEKTNITDNEPLTIKVLADAECTMQTNVLTSNQKLAGSGTDERCSFLCLNKIWPGIQKLVQSLAKFLSPPKRKCRCQQRSD